MTRQLYFVDLETTGLNDQLHEPIELSLIRQLDGKQITLLIQPQNFNDIEPDALRINGHQLDDLQRGFRTTESGVERYLDLNVALVQIEDFLSEDMTPSADRVLVGQNVQFDIRFLQSAWRRAGHHDTYPFGRMYLDTMQIAFFL